MLFIIAGYGRIIVLLFTSITYLVRLLYYKYMKKFIYIMLIIITVIAIGAGTWYLFLRNPLSNQDISQTSIDDHIGQIDNNPEALEDSRKYLTIEEFGVRFPIENPQIQDATYLIGTNNPYGDESQGEYEYARLSTAKIDRGEYGPLCQIDQGTDTVGGVLFRGDADSVFGPQEDRMQDIGQEINGYYYVYRPMQQVCEGLEYEQYYDEMYATGEAFQEAMNSLESAN